ncbi:FGGY-family carbohydrate kinase [Candidatus Enterococcus clewellii]|uniref:ATP:glycerol 3-phosphotransferase n=1 Tax=Candidatus Enterococcus clewellii TaxID=1834193 RepID=A0A242KD83_9ENTE|nr:FGGY family carbohydrate kinase [Enterococcus sp. 9E7_DIV0242]OTP19112.1 glycerol kinase [Enterococcus sp. 9E7_DIV0242]
MARNYQMVLDQSTSGTKLLLLKDGRIVQRYDKKHKQFYPQNGWVEHDPLEIWDNVEALLTLLFQENSLEYSDISALSITNQRETILAWDKTTGEPIYNAIVWQCNRSAALCESLIEQGMEELINQKTGLRIDPYFSGTKVKWLYDELPEVAEKSGTGELAIGTIDSWLIWKLTEGAVFATDASNACRTLLYNINTKTWDDELLQLFSIDHKDLPEIRKADSVFGAYQGIPIIGVMADSQAALLGEGCRAFGDVKITMGTGCSVMMQINKQNSLRDLRILTTTAWQQKKDEAYALEGIIRSCGDAINWFSQAITATDDISERCNKVLLKRKEESVFFIPALQGLGAPFWKNTETAAFNGITRTTTQEELLRAVLESIIFQIKAVLDVMEEVSNQPINQVFIDGGVSKNRPLMSLLATLLNKEVIVSEVEEFSALGVAMLAEPTIQWEIPQERFQPSIKQKEVYGTYQKWKRLIEQELSDSDGESGE